MADIFSSQSGKIIFKSPLGALQIEVDIDGNVSVDGDMVVKGDLTVQGSGTSKDQTSLTVKDSLIIANFGEDILVGPVAEEGRGFVVDRGAFSIITIDDPDDPTSATKLEVVQRQDDGVIQTNGTGTPVWRDDSKHSRHKQILTADEGVDLEDPGTYPAPVAVDVTVPRGLIWQEDSGLWDLSWEYKERQDADGKPANDPDSGIPPLTVDDVYIRGIATPATIPTNDPDSGMEDTHANYAATIEYVNKRSEIVQDDLDILKDYFNVDTAPLENDIMYWNSTTESWDARIMDITLDTSPILGADLDVDVYSITGDSVTLVSKTGTNTLELDGTGLSVVADQILLHGIKYPVDGNDEDKIMAVNASGELEFRNIDDVPTSGISNVVEDDTPQLGGDFDVQEYKIFSSNPTANPDGNIVLDTGEDGRVVIEGDGHAIIDTPADIDLTLIPGRDLYLNRNKWPAIDGINGYSLVTDGTGNARWRLVTQVGIHTVESGNGTNVTLTQEGDNEAYNAKIDVVPGNGVKLENSKVTIDLADDSGLLVDSTGLMNKLTISSSTNGTTDTVARGDHKHVLATDAKNGFMDMVDKVKLDGIETSAELNTATNLGVGTGIYSDKTGSELQFKSLIAGNNISLVATANDITISSPDDLVQSVTGGDGLTNVGDNTTGEVELAVDVSVVRTSRSIFSGVGLTGGGNLTANRTLAVDFTTSGGNNGTATTVSRGDHTHDYVSKSGDTMTGELTAPSFNTNSALHYKEEITPFENALEKVMGIDVINYVSKGDADRKKRLGVSAESLAEVVPELVAFKDGRPDAVNYAQGFALLTQAIQEQEQNRTINKLKRVFDKMTAFFNKGE